MFTALFQVFLAGAVLKTTSHPFFEFSSSAIPKWTLFSNLTQDVPYVAGLSVTALFLTYTAVSKWVNDDKYNLSEDTGKSELRFAPFVFNLWDFNVEGEEPSKDLRLATESSLSLLLDQENIAARVNARTEEEKWNLFFRRAGGLTVNIILIIASWTIVCLFFRSKVNLDYYCCNISKRYILICSRIYCFKLDYFFFSTHCCINREFYSAHFHFCNHRI